MKGKSSSRAPFLGLIMILLAASLLLVIDQRQAQAAASFRFISWADTKSDRDILSELSDQAVKLNPAFSIYPGDLESSGFTSSGMAKWIAAMNGELTGDSAPNGMADIVFAVRGNHDDSNTSGWQSFWNFAQTASRVGATNFSHMPGQEDLTYSFDYGNAHIVGIDVPGDADKITDSQVHWLDQDLAAAESRGLTHAFIFFHGPIYCVDGHCSYSTRVGSLSSSVENLIEVLNKHPIVSATFHGHEHTYAYTYIDETRIPPDGGFEGVTHPFHQFVTGDAGAGPKSCKENRCDYNMAKHGFVTVDVAGPTVTVTFYRMGSTSPVHTISFSKEGAPTPLPTFTPTPTTTPLPGTTFGDVPKDHWAYGYIEQLYHDGFIAGCSAQPRLYCPEQVLTRAEMSVFVERGVNGGGYMPPQPGSQIFDDVPLAEWFAKWVNKLFEDRLTAGCQVVPKLFCPGRQHTRAESTVFFERMLHGVDFFPPPPSVKVYDDVPVGAGAPWYSKWVAAAFQDGIIQECEDEANRGDAFFRPDDGLTRAEAACMMYKAKYEVRPLPTATPLPTAIPSATPTPKPPPNDARGIWISPAELAQLPMSGEAWQNVKSEADKSAGTPDLSDQDQRNNVTVLAKALVFARTGQESYRQEVRRQLEMAIDTEKGGRTLALGRELVAYVIAADLIDLKNYDSAFDQNQFRPWLRRTLSEELSGRTLVSTHEDRPNNWGTHAGASRIAVALYLGDQAELDRAAMVFKGWLGDRSAYAGFEYGDLSWQCDPSKPVGVNPKGCTKEGHSIDGVLPDDQRRAGGFKWPPPKENYVWEGLQGALVQAVLLHRAGYDVWNWEDQALLRAVKWLHEQANYPAQGDDTWQPHIINYYYGTNFPAPVPASPGKNMGWTDWTHGER